ncbi:MAG: type II secretion system protein GspD [Limisphaerales bacterium]|jgi:type II secretory pathway component GspD/PulD (secretin)
MKTKIAVAICFGATLAIGLCRAQENPATDSSAPIQDSPARVAEVLPLVQFDDAPLVDVIKTLARQADLNIIFDPRVTAPGSDGQSVYPLVSIRLEKVTAEAVLEATLNNNNLRLERDPRTGISRVTVKDPAAAEPLQMEIFQLKYTNPSNLVSIIKPTMEGRSQAIPDGRTSQLIVLATEKEILAISNLVDKVDTATRQVLIEARILETTRNPESVKGINWAGTFQAQNIYAGNNSFPMQTSGGSSSSSGQTPGAGSGAQNTVIADGITPGLQAFLRSGFQHPVAYLNADGARAVFSFFNQDSETETLATPRAVTSDNEPATLLVTRAVPIFKVTQGGTQVGNAVDITYTNLGIILEVTPRISANDQISLTVVPEVSDIESVDTQVFNGEEYSANIFSIRKITTSVMIPSGNTLVLGGLLSDTTRKSSTKVPILGDLPGMKYIFGNKSKSRRKGNLLIFVTPTVVQEADFTPTESTFLQTPVPQDPDARDMGSFDEPWDGVEPYDWGEPVY